MKVQYKLENKRVEFPFQEGDEIKIIVTSFLYATESHPELVYEGKLLGVDEDETCFYFTTKDSPETEEYMFFRDVENVIGLQEEYPNRKDHLIRWALDGTPDKQESREIVPGTEGFFVNELRHAGSKQEEFITLTKHIINSDIPADDIINLMEKLISAYDSV